MRTGFSDSRLTPSDLNLLLKFETVLDCTSITVPTELSGSPCLNKSITIDSHRRPASIDLDHHLKVKHLTYEFQVLSSNIVACEPAETVVSHEKWDESTHGFFFIYFI